MEEEQVDFIEQFISSCIKEGICSPNAICNAALKRIDEIDEILREQNVFRIEKANLRKVLRNFEHESIKRIKISKLNLINSDTSLNDMDASHKEFLIKICNYIGSVNKPITGREIMDAVGKMEENAYIYMAIKWLCEKNVLIRRDDRCLEKGDGWENRPKLLI